MFWFAFGQEHQKFPTFHRTAQCSAIRFWLPYAIRVHHQCVVRWSTRALSEFRLKSERRSCFVHFSWTIFWTPFTKALLFTWRNSTALLLQQGNLSNLDLRSFCNLLSSFLKAEKRTGGLHVHFQKAFSLGSLSQDEKIEPLEPAEEGLRPQKDQFLFAEVWRKEFFRPTK